MKFAKGYAATFRSSLQSPTVIGLTLAILGTWGFIIWFKNYDAQRQNDLLNTIQNTEKKRTELQHGYEASLGQLDSLSGINYSMTADLEKADDALAGLEGYFQRLVVGNRELEEAKIRNAKLLMELTAKKERLEKEYLLAANLNAQLKSDRDTLLNDRNNYRTAVDQLRYEIEILQEKIKIASTLNASNVNVTALYLNKKKEEVPTKNVTKADRLLLSLDVENKVIASGITELVILIHDAKGQLVQIDTTAEQVNKPYTAKFSFDIEPSQKKRVEFAWRFQDKLQKGTYHFTVYHNDSKIAECVKEVKKGKLV